MNQNVVRAMKLVVASAVAVAILLLTHPLLVFFFAFALEQSTRIPLLHSLVRNVLASPVHAQLALESLGGAHPLGFAVNGVPGQWLHTFFPAVFLDPKFATPWTVITAVIDRDSTALGIFTVLAMVDLALVVSGSVLYHLGLRGYDTRALVRRAGFRKLLAVAVALLFLVQAARGLELSSSTSQIHLADTGIGFGLALAFRPDAATYAWLMSDILPIAIPISVAFFGLALAAAICWFLDARFSPREGRHLRMRRVLNQYGWVALVLVLAAFVPLPAGSLATEARIAPAANKTTITPPVSVAEPSPQPTLEVLVVPTFSPTTVLVPTQPVDTPTVASLASSSATSTPLAVPTATPSPTSTPQRPARTELRVNDKSRSLFVNGTRTLLVGMNYNVNYTGFADDFKRARHRRDFQLLKEQGFNSIIGWGVYDQATLEIAQEFGIGVIMPFELDPQGSFENESYCNQVRERFREFVKRYRDYPAVWGWNPGGDELLHRMDTEQHRTPDKLQDAANLLLDMSVDAYALDPLHISIIKEPRDWYIPYIDVAVRKTRERAQSPDLGRFLVYGMNAYGRREDIRQVLQVVKLNSEERMKIGFMVSEYAPFSFVHKDRAQVYASLAEAIYALSPMGGYAYVFGPDQPNPQAPNPYDPLRLLVNEFSFVDINDIPVDDALATLGSKWREMQTCCAQQ